jgi:NADH:ubiquinone oxidoreductase subunit E
MTSSDADRASAEAAATRYQGRRALKPAFHSAQEGWRWLLRQKITEVLVTRAISEANAAMTTSSLGTG